MRLPSSANHSKNDAAYAISPRASASGLPCSSVISSASGSTCSVIRSDQRRRIPAPAAGGIAPPGGRGIGDRERRARVGVDPLAADQAPVTEQTIGQQAGSIGVNVSESHTQRGYSSAAGRSRLVPRGGAFPPPPPPRTARGRRWRWRWPWRSILLALLLATKAGSPAVEQV